jgi:hypothetical protein
MPSMETACRIPGRNLLVAEYQEMQQFHEWFLQYLLTYRHSEETRQLEDHVLPPSIHVIK